MLDRLHKILARAGVAALRPAEDMILQGRVTVNGRIVRELGARADPTTDVIAVDGQIIHVPEETDPHRYLMLHKPAGVISTAQDTHGRPTVVQLVPNDVRVFPVGRLDADSEGLILLTDDGDLAYRLTHPRFEVDKEYRVLVNRTPELAELRRWRAGVPFPDGEVTARAWVEVLERGTDGTWLRVVMHEGRKRQIREVARIFELDVHRLIRVREGPLALGDLPPGSWRELTREEVEALRAHTQHVPSREADEERERMMSDEDSSRPRRLRVIRRARRDDPGAGPAAEALDVPAGSEKPRDRPFGREEGAQRSAGPPASSRTGGDMGQRPNERRPAPPGNSRFDDDRSPRSRGFGQGAPPAGQGGGSRRPPDRGSRFDPNQRDFDRRESGPPRDNRGGFGQRGTGRDMPRRDEGRSFDERAPGPRRGEWSDRRESGPNATRNAPRGGPGGQRRDSAANSTRNNLRGGLGGQRRDSGANPTRNNLRGGLGGQRRSEYGGGGRRNDEGQRWNDQGGRSPRGQEGEAFEPNGNVREDRQPDRRSPRDYGGSSRGGPRDRGFGGGSAQRGSGGPPRGEGSGRRFERRPSGPPDEGGGRGADGGRGFGGRPPQRGAGRASGPSRGSSSGGSGFAQRAPGRPRTGPPQGRGTGPARGERPAPPRRRGPPRRRDDE